MAEIIFLLCAFMSTVCAVALLRGYKKKRSELLFWSGVCFLVLAANNIFLCVDLIVLPDIDLSGPFWRNLTSAVAGSVLLFGLIMEIS